VVLAVVASVGVEVNIGIGNVGVAVVVGVVLALVVGVVVGSVVIVVAIVVEGALRPWREAPGGQRASRGASRSHRWASVWRLLEPLLGFGLVGASVGPSGASSSHFWASFWQGLMLLLLLLVLFLVLLLLL
jgi:hypothetical protein